MSPNEVKATVNLLLEMAGEEARVKLLGDMTETLDQSLRTRLLSKAVLPPGELRTTLLLTEGLEGLIGDLHAFLTSQLAQCHAHTEYLKEQLAAGCPGGTNGHA